MIDKIISFSIKNPFIIGLLTLSLIIGGIYSIATVNLGSVPDITNNQVQVMTVAPNLSTEDMEQFVTAPVELAMGHLPGIKEIRSVSRFGLSVVTLVFKDDMGVYKPRQLVSEKLNDVQEQIPQGFGTPFMGPITTGLGEIYQYTIDPKPGYDSVFSVSELRTVQDWIVKRQMTMIDGVIEVNDLGGKVKQYEVALNPQKLNALNITIADVFEALENNNLNTGGAYIEKNNMASFIRGDGLVRSLDDIRSIVIKTQNGIPLTVADVAEKVHYGSQVRYGAFTHDGKERVGGMVLMLKGANPYTTINEVRDRMETIEQSLPEGLEINAFYDRSALITQTVETISDNLMEGALIVVFVLVLLLGNLRAGLITASVIPLSLLFAFILMKIFGVWANLMSLGAIDFGIIVDGAVIIVEGTVLGIEQRLQRSRARISGVEMDAMVYTSGSTMMRSAFFGQLIILIVFVPILFLQGVSGKMFHPMAYTFGFAVLGAIVLCMTYVPMMSRLLLRPLPQKRHLVARLERLIERSSNWMMAGLHRKYEPLLKTALRFRLWVLLLAAVLFGFAVYTFSQMGAEFIPQLDEGDIAMHVLLRPGTSLDRTIAVTQEVEQLLLDNFPEVKTAAAKIGVPDIPTDPMPMDIADVFIILEKDKKKWVSATSKNALIDRIRDKLNSELTGVSLAFSQPIEMRFNELMTGIRSDVAIKLYGNDFDILAQKGEQMAEMVQKVPGVASAEAERTSGLPQITVVYKRAKLAQYGLDISKLNAVVSTAFAGRKAGVVFEQGRRFDLVVRFSEPYRKNIEDLRNMYVDLPDGTQVPIKEVAEIRYQSGPMQISRENTFRSTYVGVNISGRDVESVVHDIQRKFESELQLPPGYHITYGGEFENLQEATKRLQIVIPIALLLIFVLLYLALSSFVQAIMIYAAIPLAAVGGVFFLLLRGMPFSISAGVGFVVLFGVAVLNGLVLINRFNALKADGVSDLKARILTGTAERLRPVLLTATAAITGFIPMAFSASSGAEVQRPLATVVIGGLITATFLTLIVVPILYAYTEERRHRKARRKRYKMHGRNAKLVVVGLIAGGLISFSQVVKAQDAPLWDSSAISHLPGLTLEQAQRRAVDHYPSMQLARLQVEQQEALKVGVWDFGNTTLYTGKEEFGNGAAGLTTTLAVKQGPVDVFGIAPALKLHKAQVNLARQRLRLTGLGVQQQAAKAWIEAYVQKKLYNTYQQLDSLFDDIRRAAEVKLEAEEISKLEYLALMNQASTVQVDKAQAYADYLAALQQFNRWWSSDTLYGVADVPDTKWEVPLLVQSDSLKQHPMLQLGRQRIAAAGALVDKRRSGYWPKLQGEFGWQELAGQSGFYSYQLGLSVPLFSGPQRAAVKSAVIARKVAEVQLVRDTMRLQADFRRAVTQYRKWKTAWEYYRNEGLPLAEKQKAGAMVAYREGNIDYVAFLQNIRNVITTEVAAWETFRKYLESRNGLNFYLHENI